MLGKGRLDASMRRDETFDSNSNSDFLMFLMAGLGDGYRDPTGYSIKFTFTLKGAWIRRSKVSSPSLRNKHFYSLPRVLSVL
jgi:hypothetical protein